MTHAVGREHPLPIPAMASEVAQGRKSRIPEDLKMLSSARRLLMPVSHAICALLVATCASAGEVVLSGWTKRFDPQHRHLSSAGTSIELRLDVESLDGELVASGTK